MGTERKTAFDSWLHASLHKQFDSAKSEQVPDALLQLLQPTQQDTPARG